MTISVVIPAYNEEKYISATLEAIKKLTRKPDEIIIIDGGSTDRTKQIAQKHGARVITVPHRGIGFARQKGLEDAVGDVIAFTDADTIVPPDWLTKAEETLSKPGVVATYGMYKVDNGRLFYRLIVNIGNPLTFFISNLFGVHIVGGQNMAFWKDKGLACGGFPTNFRSAEDFEFMRKLAKLGKVVYRTDNTVISSGRRGDEGWRVITRVSGGFLRYFLTGKADTFDFPDIR